MYLVFHHNAVTKEVKQYESDAELFITCKFCYLASRNDEDKFLVIDLNSGLLAAHGCIETGFFTGSFKEPNVLEESTRLSMNYYVLDGLKKQLPKIVPAIIDGLILVKRGVIRKVIR